MAEFYKMTFENLCRKIGRKKAKEKVKVKMYRELLEKSDTECLRNCALLFGEKYDEKSDDSLDNFFD